MQSTQLSLIVKKLTEFYGTSFDNFAYKSPLSGTKNYSSTEIDAFINALIQAARKQDLLMVENYANEHDFKELIKTKPELKEFVKPNKVQRIELWKKLLPANLPLEKDFDIEELAKKSQDKHKAKIFVVPKLGI